MLGDQPAIAVVADSSLRLDSAIAADPNEVEGNDVSVALLGVSYAQIGTGLLTGDVNIDLHSVLRAGGLVTGGDPNEVSIDGDIEISRASALAIDSPEITINGAVTCLDAKSSLSGTFSGTHSISCRDFDEKGVDKK